MSPSARTPNTAKASASSIALTPPRPATSPNGQDLELRQNPPQPLDGFHHARRLAVHRRLFRLRALPGRRDGQGLLGARHEGAHVGLDPGGGRQGLLRRRRRRSGCVRREQGEEDSERRPIWAARFIRRRWWPTACSTSIPTRICSPFTMRNTSAWRAMRNRGLNSNWANPTRTNNEKTPFISSCRAGLCGAPGLLELGKADPMIFGFLPIGLAYHAAYSIAAAVMMAMLVKFAWPKRLDEHETASPEPPPPHRDSGHCHIGLSGGHCLHRQHGLPAGARRTRRISSSPTAPSARWFSSCPSSPPT